MSSGKTLSNGTLSLRFMQNAHRAKQQAAIDLERAKVQDEAEWEVSKEVREAWGLASSSKSQTGQAIAHETSYLPFLFPTLQNSGPSSNDASTAEASTTTSRISGRRTFAKGREVVSTPSSPDGPGGADIKQERNATESSEPLSEQPKARYALGAGPLTKTRAHKMAELDRAGRLPAKGTSAPGVPVLSMISEETSAVVGRDMRQMRKLKGTGIASAATTEETKPSVSDTDKAASSIGKGPLSFLRPAGIDSPASSSTDRKKSRKRERDAEASLGLAGKKADSEPISIADASESQRRQVTKKRKKQKNSGSGRSTPTS